MNERPLGMSDTPNTPKLFERAVQLSGRAQGRRAMLNELNLRKFLAPLAARGKAVLRNFALASVCTLGLSSVAQAQTYVWSGNVTLGAGNTTATGSVGSVNYTISSTAAFGSSTIWNAGTFPSSYGISSTVVSFTENAGGTYTLTFDRPVESPLIAIASLGQVGQTAVGFDFGSSVNLLWTGSYETSGWSVTPSSGTATSISGVEGYAIAKYSGTVTSVTFHPNAESNGSMQLLIGFEVSTTAPTITAPGGTAGDASAALTRPELQTAVGDFDANKAVVWSITGGADQAKFTINSATGVLSFATAPNYSSPTDVGANNTYEVALTATDLQATPQTATQTVTVTVTDATAPTVAIQNAPARVNSTAAFNATFEFSEDVTGFAVGDITVGNGSASNFVATDANTYTADITPNGAGDITIDVAANVAQDAASNNNTAATQVTIIYDSTTPTLSSSSPADNATGVTATSDIVLTFSEAIAAGTGNITLYKADGTQVQAFDVTSGVTISGSTITLNPTSDLESGASYYVRVDATAVDDLAGNNYAGIANATTLNFAVTDSTAPTLSSSSPADNATGVTATSDIVLTFSEAIAAGTGNITLYKADGTLVQAFDVTSGVMISGSTITLNPTSDLESGASYYVQVDATAVDDLAGYSYAGIADATTLNFTVALAANTVTVARTVDGIEANNGTAQDGVFTVSMDRTATVATVITYSVSGTATSGSDFTALSGTVTIPAGQTSATITVPVLEDDLVEGAETVVLTLTGVTGDSATSLASSPSATITIGDDLIDTIRNQLSDVLGSDLARTVDTQSRQFGDMSKAALRRLHDGGEDACGTVQPFDVDGSAALNAGDAQANGSFGSETYDCATRTHHITTGSFALNTVDGMGTQGMASVVFMTEKMHSDTDLRGKFWGGYLSRNNVSTIADGTITGFGLNGGLYGARQLQDGLFLDYYAALAGGRHQFELIFANATADITAEGDYSYLAAFGGLALSSEKAFERFTLRPRVGVDLAYAKASAASVTATQLTQTDTGEVDVPSYQGVRGFAELVFAFGDDRDATDTFGPLRSYEFAPRLLCQNALDGAGHDCGFGVNVDYLWDAKEEGQRFGVTLDYEHVAESDALSVELRRETAIFDGAGKAVTAVAASSSGNPQFSHTVELRF